MSTNLQILPEFVRETMLRHISHMTIEFSFFFWLSLPCTQPYFLGSHPRLVFMWSWPLIGPGVEWCGIWLMDNQPLSWPVSYKGHYKRRIRAPLGFRQNNTVLFFFFTSAETHIRVLFFLKASIFQLSSFSLYLICQDEPAFSWHIYYSRA